MDQESLRILAKRYEFISYRLNHEAYMKQMVGRVKPLRHFNPCSRALIFTAAIGRHEMVSSLVIHNASRTHCACHPDMDKQDLQDLYGISIKEMSDGR